MEFTLWLVTFFNDSQFSIGSFSFDSQLVNRMSSDVASHNYALSR